MRNRILGLFGALALVAATWQNSGTLQNQGDVVQQRCDQGQSQAVIEIPATTAPGPTPTPVATGTPTAGPTSTAGPFNGTIYFETATNNGGAPNPFGSPLVVTPANSSTYTNSISAIPTPSAPELKYYVTLGADQWVQARLASPGPNNGAATVKVTCTTAVAFRSGSSGGGGGGSFTSLACSAPIVCFPNAGPTPSVAFGACTFQQHILNTCSASPMPSGYPTPQSYYCLCETSGTTLHDSVGSNNLTVNGTPQVNYALCVSMMMPDGSCGFNTDGVGGYASFNGTTQTGSWTVGMMASPCRQGYENGQGFYFGGTYDGTNHRGVVFGNLDAGAPENFLSFGASGAFNNVTLNGAVPTCTPVWLAFTYDSTGTVLAGCSGACYCAWVNATCIAQANQSLTGTTSITVGGLAGVAGYYAQGYWCCLTRWGAAIDGTYFWPLMTAFATGR